MNRLIAVRLHRGDDLLKEIRRLAAEHNISCGAVISAVGCVSCARVRDAGGVNIRSIDCGCEIVSLTGTISNVRNHLHIALAKEDLTVVGGHLVEGCIINTTCELIILSSSEYRIVVEEDESTGYDEAVFVSD